MTEQGAEGIKMGWEHEHRDYCKNASSLIKNIKDPRIHAP